MARRLFARRSPEQQRGTLQAVTSDQCFKTPATPCSYWQNWFHPAANDPDLIKRWLCGGIQDLGEPEVTELLLDWIDPFITHAVTLQAGAKQQNECSRQAFQHGDCQQIHTLIPKSWKLL